MVTLSSGIRHQHGNTSPPKNTHTHTKKHLATPARPHARRVAALVCPTSSPLPLVAGFRLTAARRNPSYRSRRTGHSENAVPFLSEFRVHAAPISVNGGGWRIEAFNLPRMQYKP